MSIERLNIFLEEVQNSKHDVYHESTNDKGGFNFVGDKNIQKEFDKYSSALEAAGFKYDVLDIVPTVATYNWSNKSSSLLIYEDKDDGIIYILTFDGIQGQEYDELENMMGISFSDKDAVLENGIVRSFIEGKNKQITIGFEYLKNKMTRKVKDVIEELILAVEYNKHSKKNIYIIDKHIKINKINSKTFDVAGRAISFL